VIAWDRPELGTLLIDATLPPGLLRVELTGFDAVVAYSRNAALQRGLSGIGLRVVAHDPSPPPGWGHAGDWFAQPIRSFGAAVPSQTPPASVPTAHETAVARTLRDRLPEAFLAIHPGSGSALKNWPANRFWALAEARARGESWLLMLGPAEASLRAPRGAVVARELPARIAGALVSEAGVYLGNDSGASHLAAAWGAPSVALFGPTDPAVWAPIGADVRLVRSKTGAMDGIAVDDVLSAM
jgi:ADP-heptose:LPS heptosyltransferase